MTERHAALFHSAYEAGNLSPESVLEFHKQRYGGVDLRMEGDEGGSGGDAGGDAGDKGGEGAQGAGGASDKGFPDATPVAEMTESQQAAYWKHQARKHQTRAEARQDYDQVKAELDRIRASSLTDGEKAIQEAATKARQEGETAAAARFAERLVAAKFETVLAGKRKPDEISTLVEGIDTKKFLTDTGEVDTDKVTQYAAGLGASGAGWPDTGQGKRGTGTSGKGVAAGAELFAAKRGKKTT